MKDAVGWHLHESFLHYAASIWAFVREDYDAYANLDGAAHGHAFRAAELAYDLGQKHSKGSHD